MEVVQTKSYKIIKNKNWQPTEADQQWLKEELQLLIAHSEEYNMETELAAYKFLQDKHKCVLSQSFSSLEKSELNCLKEIAYEIYNFVPDVFATTFATASFRAALNKEDWVFLEKIFIAEPVTDI